MKRAWLIAPMLMLLVPHASATTVRGFTLPQLYREAARVVVGTVTGSRSFWNDAHDTIYTEHTVTVERTLKGDKTATVTVRQMGGQVGPTRLTVEGTAVLAKGERVLLVLRDHGAFATLVGMAQGKWSVRTVQGTDRVWRGEALGDRPVRQGERALADLIEQLRGTNPQ